jgi:conjugative relaxase-like TrwC/TraI family protein
LHSSASGFAGFAILVDARMLSIGKIVQGQHRYYERQVAGGEDDYYSGRGEAPGEWAGAGARALGLVGRVSAEQFNALIAGCDPRDTGSRLRSTPGDPKVAAFDLTFSAPKSVSVLFAIAPARVSGALAACHEEAVRAALGFLEDAAVKVRRGRAGERMERGEGLIAAAYRHRMSRALDPQLHTHVVAANLARGPDGRFTALHSAELYKAAKTVGFLYQAHLRALVSERLGLEWGPVRNGAGELAGVAREVIEFFSKRRQEMQRAAAEGGIGLGSKSAAEQAALATRERKQYGIETHTWREEVQACAGEQGLGTDEVAYLLQAGQERASQAMTGHPTVDEQIVGDHLAGPGGLTERSNTFDARMVVQEFAAAAQAGALVAEVCGKAGRFAAREDVIATSGGEMTTAELVGVERRLIAAVMGRAREHCGVVGRRLAERVIAGADRELTPEQARAVRTVVGSGHGVSVIEALAGTGKTYTAGVLREVYEAAGTQVVGVAPTGRAARELTVTHVRLRELRERIKELQAQLHALAPEPKDSTEASAERDGLAQALDQAARERTQILDQLTEREQQTPSQWAKTTLGELPDKPHPRAAWEKAVRAAVSYRAQQSITDPQDPLGPRPEQREQRREWQSAQRAIERAQRRLHRTPSHPIDLGIGF